MEEINNTFLKTILIDAERPSLKMLSEQLSKYCPDVTVAAECHCLLEAIDVIEAIHPDLVFVDLGIPSFYEINLINGATKINFEIILTTSCSNTASTGTAKNSGDYLLKPVLKEELQLAVRKAQYKKAEKELVQKILQLNAKEKHLSQTGKIAIPTLLGFDFINVDEIIYCESSSNYTIFTFKDNTQLVVSKTLKEIGERLVDYGFLRVHNSYIINLNQIKSFIKSDGGYLMMANRKRINVSRKYKHQIMELILSPSL